MKKGEVITKFNVLGHALYDEYGKDIVCAAVSGILISNINGILKLNSNYLNYQKNNTGLSITIKIHDNVVNTLIANVIDCLKDLASQYPKNIKILTKEEK